MTKQIEIAKANLEAFDKARIAALFHQGPEPVEADYGYKHGWIILNGVSYSREQLTGVPYDMNQGGWAWV